MKKTLLSAIALSFVVQADAATSYVKTVRAALFEQNEAVVNACLGDGEDLKLKYIDPKQLAGDAAQEYKRVVKEYVAGLDKGEKVTQEDLDEQGISAAIFQVGPHKIQMVANVLEGNGGCQYFTKEGSYVARVDGTESSNWDLE